MRWPRPLNIIRLSRGAPSVAQTRPSGYAVNVNLATSQAGPQSNWHLAKAISPEPPMQISDDVVRVALATYNKALSDLSERADDTPVSLDDIREVGLRAALE